MRKQIITSLLVFLVIACTVSSFGIYVFFDFKMDEIIETNLNDTLKQVDTSLKFFDFVKYSLEIDLNNKSRDVLPKIAKRLGSSAKVYTSHELKEIAKEFGVDEIYLINKDMLVYNTSYPRDMNLDLKDVGELFESQLRNVYGRGKVFNQASLLSISSGSYMKYAYYSPPASDYIIEISFDINSYLKANFGSNYNIQIFFDFLNELPASSTYLTSTDLLYITRRRSWSFLHKNVNVELSSELKNRIFDKKIVKERKGDHLRVYYDETLNPYAKEINPQSSSIKRVLVLQFDFSSVRDFQDRIIFGTIICTCAAFVITVIILAPFIYRRYLKRITSINEALNKLAIGEFHEPLKLKGNDELSNIARNVSKVTQEISSRENAIKENEENLSITLQSIGDAVIVTDPDGLVVRMNPVAEKLTGRTFQQARGRHLAEVFHIVQAETRLQLENPVEKVLITGQQQGLGNNTMLITPDGREYQIADSAAPIRTELGELIGVVMVFRDVSEEYRRNKILQKQQALMAATFKMAPFGMIIMKAGVVLEANDRCLSILGYDRDEIVGHTTQKLYTSYDEYVRVCEQHKTTAKNETTLDEYIWRHKNGREINVLIAMAPLANYAEGEDIVTVMDITERKKMEKYLTQTQKMEAVGQLAGGMAHDLNSFFSSISGYAEMLQIQDISEEDRNNYAQKILTTVDQASRLNAQLISFSRKNKILSSNLSIHNLIGSTLDIIRDNIPDNIELGLRMNANRDIIAGDIALLKSAIVTLCINARESLPNGGKLTISTNLATLTEAYCQSSPFNLEPGEYIQISVADTGMGIAQENLSRIFEPFFSTTEANKDVSGLGLAAVYGTVVSHKGAINVHSVVGQGTVFHIYLPLVSAAKAAKVQQQASQAPHGKILVVDDEPLIRNMAKAQLDALGYSSLTACNGQEGVEIFEKNKDSIELIILDMIMPVMDGYKAFRAFRDIKPDIKIIITSGFSASPKTQQLMKDGNCEFLQKPMHLSRLAKFISKMLGNE